MLAALPEPRVVIEWGWPGPSLRHGARQDLHPRQLAADDRGRRGDPPEGGLATDDRSEQGARIGLDIGATKTHGVAATADGVVLAEVLATTPTGGDDVVAAAAGVVAELRAARR